MLISCLVELAGRFLLAHERSGDTSGNTGKEHEEDDGDDRENDRPGERLTVVNAREFARALTRARSARTFLAGILGLLLEPLGPPGDENHEDDKDEEDKEEDRADPAAAVALLLLVLLLGLTLLVSMLNNGLLSSSIELPEVNPLRSAGTGHYIGLWYDLLLYGGEEVGLRPPRRTTIP